MEVSKVEGTVAAEEEAEEMEEEMEDAATAAEPDEKEVIAAEASVLEAAAEAMAEEDRAIRGGSWCCNCSCGE